MKTIHLAPGIDTGLAALIDSRGLIQANSGGGKSWVLRRCSSSRTAPCSSYVLAAKQGGDTAAEPRAAGLLAQRGSGSV